MNSNFVLFMLLYLYERCTVLPCKIGHLDLDFN